MRPRSFNAVEPGQHFTCCGVLYRKRSTRTAEIVWPERFAGEWFYMRQTMPVNHPYEGDLLRKVPQ